MLRPCLGFDGPCPDNAVTPRSRCRSCQSRYEAARPSRRKKGRYDTKHNRLRALTLREQPWCAVCRCGDSPENPLQADHIVPHELGGKNVRSNYQTLCRRHNVQKGSQLGTM